MDEALVSYLQHVSISSRCFEVDGRRRLSGLQSKLHAGIWDR